MHVSRTPTVAGNFSHVSKATIIEAVNVFAPEYGLRLSKLEKGLTGRRSGAARNRSGRLPEVLSAVLMQEEEEAQRQVQPGE